MRTYLCNDHNSSEQNDNSDNSEKTNGKFAKNSKYVLSYPWMSNSFPNR